MEYDSLDDIKYQVFVSSAFRESTVRAIVFDAIITAGHVPVNMESFPPSAERTLSIVRRTISESPIYILILGHYYGSLIEDEPDGLCEGPGAAPGVEWRSGVGVGAGRISYTEFEYNLAKECNARVLVFIRNEAEINAERAKLDPRSEEAGNNERLFAFLDRVKRDGNLQCFWSINDMPGLGIRVVAALNKEISRLDDEARRKGWVRASGMEYNSVVLPTIKNELRREIVERFNTFTNLDRRCAEFQPEKRELACVFREVFLPLIVRQEIDLFLDAGSTIAYVARELGVSGELMFVDTNRGLPRIHIATNNALAYLQLWLTHKVPCTMFPSGSPEEPYGATYGPLTMFGQEKVPPRPNYLRKALSSDERDRIDKLRRMDMWPKSRGEHRQLLVGQISGIQLGDSPATIPDMIDDQSWEAIRSYRGFHVGDYHNMLFKRYLCESRLPIVFCINYQKVDLPIIFGQCHLVFDEEFPWDRFLSEYPVSFCVGCPMEAAGGAMDAFEKLGFRVYEHPRPSARNEGCVGFVVTNAAFDRAIALGGAAAT